MIKPVQEKTNSPNAYQEGYQQALDDFDISQLLLRLSNSLEKDLDVQGLDWQEQEIESLAALLIGQLTTSLKGSLVTDYLNAIWHGEADMISRLPLINVQLPESIALPKEISVPLFSCGDCLRWKPLSQDMETDFGMAIGRFYVPASHRSGAWTWKYLILLDKNSPSSTMTVADTAWEEDMEQIEKETSG